MRNVSVSVYIFTRPSRRDRCWKGRVKGKITSIAFFHAWFADSSLGIFPWVARPLLKPIIYFFYTNRPSNVNPLTKKASVLNLGGLRLGPGECGYEKTAVSTTRDSYGLSLTALSSKFEGLCHALRKIAEVILRETRPPTPSYYSSYDVWYSRYVRTRLYACLSTSLYWWL